jgi:putative DNA primase/helicase
VAARVSTGRPWPDEPAEAQNRAPGGVLLLDETDDSADTLHPRLEALGADLDRVVLLRSFVRAGKEPIAMPFSIAGNLNMLESCIRKVPDCRLVILDPLSVYLNGNRRRTAPGELIGSLIETAVKFDVAILVVSHVSSSAHGLFNYRSPANHNFAAAARTIWSIYADREQANRRLFAPMKNNLGRDTHGLAFRIETCEEYDAPRIVWENTPLEIAVEKTMLATSVRSIQNTYVAQREFASNWLRNQLLAGQRLAQEILAAARLEKIAEKSLRRALREIGGTTQKGPSGHYVWLIPDQSGEDSCDNDYELSQLGHDKDVANLAKLTNLANLDLRSHERLPRCDLENKPVFP